MRKTVWFSCSVAGVHTLRQVFVVIVVLAAACKDDAPSGLSLTSPTSGASLTGVVTLEATAATGLALEGVQFLVDGAPVGAEDTTAPYTLELDTLGLANSAHTFAAQGRIAAGDPVLSATVSATVANLPGIDERVANPTCRAPQRPTPPPTGSYGLQPLFPNLSTGAGGPFSSNSPVVVQRVRMPNGQWSWFVALRTGRVVQITNPATSTLPPINFIEPYSNRDRTEEEGGFLGLAFDPDIATNPDRAFVYYTHADYGGVMLYRARVTLGSNGLYTTSQETLVLQAGAGSHHYGGDVKFGPDGYLYMSVGEDEIFARTRSPNNLRGKILRIDVHSTALTPNYGIPSDNPYAGNAACSEDGADLPDASHPCPEVWARGFRNPFRFSFDAESGALWVGDVGAAHEEINLVTRDGDYGWNTQEGLTSPDPGITAAVAEIPREGCSTAGYAIIGGVVYRGSAISSLLGKYVTADNGNGKLFVLDNPYTSNRSLSTVSNADCGNTSFYPSAFAEDENHELYIVSLHPGTGMGVYKLVPAGAEPDPTGGPPARLADTGCFDGTSREPIAAAIPYAVNAELWSDGASKRRWMVLPDGGSVTVDTDGDWQFPIGTVLIKEFAMGARLLETRLLVRHDDGDWAGYTYVWNDAQTEATLATSAVDVDPGDGGAAWGVPSRGECLSCHTTGKGRALGPETRQLNGAFEYPNGRRANQLATLAHLGVLDGAFADPRAHAAFPQPGDDSVAVEPRARAYLHANCSHCHPGPGAKPDLGFDTSFADMTICGEAPTSPVPGGTQLMVPGDAATSILGLRMKDLGANRMPRIGSRRVDAAGVSLVDAWINETTSCAR